MNKEKVSTFLMLVVAVIASLAFLAGCCYIVFSGKYNLLSILIYVVPVLAALVFIYKNMIKPLAEELKKDRQ